MVARRPVLAVPRRWALTLLFLAGFMAAVALHTPDPPTWRSMHLSPPSWTGKQPDLDTALIHTGLLRAHSFAGTLRWWTGTWVGQVPFYRPLTSYVFWFEWQGFGDREYLYLIPTLLIHALASGLFGLLSYRLAEHYEIPAAWPAALVGALGFAGVLSPQRMAAAGSVAALWKNQPDSLAAVCLFSAFLCYLRARAGSRRAMAGTVFFYLAACGFKEIAVLFPAVCLAVEAAPFLGGERAPVLRRLGLLAAAAASFLVVRFSAIRGLGYTYGSNRSWLLRTVGEAFGPFGGPIITQHWLGPALAGWLFGLGWLAWYGWRQVDRVKGGDVTARRFRLVILLAAVAVAGAAALGAIYYSFLAPDAVSMTDPDTWATGLLVAMDFSSARYASTGIFGLAVLVTLVTRRPWVLFLAAVWTLTFLLPLVVSPGPSHRYYLSQAGYIIGYSLAVGLWLAALRERVPQRFRRRLEGTGAQA